MKSMFFLCLQANELGAFTTWAQNSTNADGSNDREKKKHNNAEKWQQI